MKWILALVMILTTSCYYSVNSVKIENGGTEENIGKAYDSVVMLYTYSKKDKSKKPRGSATGFAVDEDRLMTAAHFCTSTLSGQVLGDLGQDVMIQYLEGGKIKTMGGFEVEELDAANDLCTLKKEDHGFPPLKINTDELSRRQKIWILGAPLGVFPMETQGKVMHLDAGHLDDSLKGMMLLSCPVFAGNSGGPVLDENGHVVGVLVRGALIYPQLSLAIKAQKVDEFLKKIHEEK